MAEPSGSPEHPAALALRRGEAAARPATSRNDLARRPADAPRIGVSRPVGVSACQPTTPAVRVPDVRLSAADAAPTRPASVPI
ncbi:hypothetical protein QF026_007707 [Streptomyces aurantiacus]|nr:hypothetical protein [Streptomyces aurantiacus]